MNIANTYQPEPISNNEKASWEQVMDDYESMIVGHCYKDEIIRLMKDRDNFGRNKYGTPLQPFNGRDSLADAVAELADGAVYLRNAISEGQDQDNLLWNTYKIVLIALENTYIAYKSQFFCEHEFETSCPEGCN